MDRAWQTARNRPRDEPLHHRARRHRPQNRPQRGQPRLRRFWNRFLGHGAQRLSPHAAGPFDCSGLLSLRKPIEKAFPGC